MRSCIHVWLVRYLLAVAFCFNLHDGMGWALDGLDPLKLTAANGWKAFEIVGQGNDISAIADEGYGAIASGMMYDGLGAVLIGENLTIEVNHETAIHGAISCIDVSLPRFKQAIASHINNGATPFPDTFVTGMGYAYERIYTGLYHAINNPLPVAEGTIEVGVYGELNLTRLCSGTSYLPELFGPGRGFMDALYLTGEETFDSTGQFFAIDQVNRVLWEIPDVGQTSWENAALVDTGDTSHVALIMNADIPGAPIRLYVGEKNLDVNLDGTIDVLERNGLRGGQMYYFHPNEGFPLHLPVGEMTGTWRPNLTGALTEEKLEDLHTNPLNGRQVVFADQTDGVFVLNLDLQFVDGNFDDLNSSAAISLIDPAGVETAGIGKPDNVVWASDGMIYVQEDSDGNDMWQLNPSTGDLVKICRAATQSSGIFDISSLIGYQGGSILLASIQGASGVNAQLVTLISPTAAVVPDSADFDFDGDVDGRDLLIWQRHFGYQASAFFEPGDANYDARVDADDLAVWQAQYGVEPGSLRSVPEPASAILFCLALAYARPVSAAHKKSRGPRLA